MEPLMPADIVERVKVDRWTNRDGEDVTSYKVTLVNETGQREVNCYSPLGKDLKEDAPLPEGWEVKTSKAGKPYLAAPRQSSGGGGGRYSGAPASAAWRNTEAGAKYEQERMDRRTACMQAVAMGTIGGSQGALTASVLKLADEFYQWLRKSVDGGGEKSNSSAPQEAAPPSSAKRSPNQPPAGWNA
jgi:hypothetical protein